ncbi:MAG: 16S rRNA (cytidine(1402)-2'-O)-methyltransferase [Chloroflexi bacterium]|nr:MAG: 16S rRNA (cytidine(1402)-2'-O)-methyltransferase [Chloroflexota bacterium]
MVRGADAGPLLHHNRRDPGWPAGGRARSLPLRAPSLLLRHPADTLRLLPGLHQLDRTAGRGPGGRGSRLQDPGRGAGAAGGARRALRRLHAADQAAGPSPDLKRVGKLYLVSTPIGNLDDITLRALHVLETVDLIAAEDTRHTLKLLTHFGLRRPLVSLHAHNEQRQLAAILERLQHHDVALVSDAGTPALSDPGVRLVSAAVASGQEVIPVPGPSAVLAALVASGLPTNQFTFLGFLPRRRGELERLLREAAESRRTFLFFESPHRMLKTLAIMAAAIGPRSVVVARELTKKHEEFLRGTPAELSEHFQRVPPRGELTVVVAGSEWREARKHVDG